VFEGILQWYNKFGLSLIASNGVKKAMFSRLIARITYTCITCLFAVVCLPPVSPSAGMLEPANGDPTVSLVPVSTTIAPGEQCTLQVMVDDAVDSLSCVELYVAYDSAIVQCIQAQKGDLYESASFPTFFDWDHIASDTATAVACVLGHRSYIVAPGELVRFVFEGLDIGVSLVSITAVNLTDIDRNALNVIVAGDAEIRVSTQTGLSQECPVPARMLNYPNPFNPLTHIELWLQAELGSKGVSVSIYSPDGKCVKKLHNGPLFTDRMDFIWDGTNERGAPVTAGIYFAVADAASMRMVRKLVLLR
jgi:hypothetical protein